MRRPHGYDRFILEGCECETCWTAFRARNAARTAVEPEEVPHGTRRRYGQGCHCEECREANRWYQRAYRARRKGVGG